MKKVNLHSKTIFSWNANFSKVNSLFETLIDENQLKTLKTNPPKEFLAENATNPKAEFFIPIVADKYIKEGEGVIKVIPTSAKWFGVTYKEDAPMVRESLRKLINAGDYPENLRAK